MASLTPAPRLWQPDYYPYPADPGNPPIPIILNGQCLGTAVTFFSGPKLGYACWLIRFVVMMNPTTNSGNNGQLTVRVRLGGDATNDAAAFNAGAGALGQATPDAEICTQAYADLGPLMIPWDLANSRPIVRVNNPAALVQNVTVVMTVMSAQPQVGPRATQP